jgi:TonB family protein
MVGRVDMGGLYKNIGFKITLAGISGSCRGVVYCFCILISSAAACPVDADPLEYQRQFMEEVVEFANHNRLNIARLHRDIHANCYIPVTVATVIRSDGSVKDAFIVKSSTVPVVDRYFLYVIRQAAPYEPLANHYDPAPEEITITEEFKLDVQLWGYGTRSTRPCEELKPRESRSNKDVGAWNSM